MTRLRTDLFGMPLVMQAEDHAYAVRLVRTAWALQAGSPPASFSDDVGRLADWFHPRLRGMTLRDRLGELPPLETGPGVLHEEVLLACGDGRYLVTPEGRAWLECATGVVPADDGIVIFAAEQGLELEWELLAVYRTWSRHRLADVIEKRTGAGAPLLPAAAALILLLLVNRSFGPDTAIRRVRDPEAQAKIDGVIADALEAFSDVLGQSTRVRDRRHFSLWSGYPLTEARRRLASQLRLDRECGAVYLAEDAEQQVTHFVAHDLARRSDANPETVGKAFDALVRAYRGSLDQLARLGSGFERVGRTEALRERLVEEAGRAS